MDYFGNAEARSVIFTNILQSLHRKKVRDLRSFETDLVDFKYFPRRLRFRLYSTAQLPRKYFEFSLEMIWKTMLNW